MMRRTLRLGAIGLMTGAMLAVAAPTGAGALTPINVGDEDIQFPESMVGSPTLPEGGTLFAFDRVEEVQSSGTAGSQQSEDEDDTEGTVVVGSSHGMPASVKERLGLDSQQGDNLQSSQEVSGPGLAGVGGTGGFPASTNQSGGSAVPLAFGNGSNVAGPTMGGSFMLPAQAAESETPPVPVDDDNVTSAPEPATWIMMIAGFWIVAWRLRSRRRADGPMIPATA